MQKNQNNNTLILIFAVLAVGGMGLLVIGGAGALFFLTSKPAPAPVSSHSGKPVVRPVSKNSAPKIDGAMLGGASTMGGKKYKPTSQYMEEGADSDTTELSFDKGSGGSAQQAPEREVFDESVVQGVMYEHQEDLIGCYAEGLESDESLAGEVSFHFRVATDGHVALVRLTSSGLRDKQTEDCIVDASRRWKFPATGQPGLVKFNTSFEFATQ
jgi:hypothetical protein